MREITIVSSEASAIFDERLASWCSYLGASASVVRADRSRMLSDLIPAIADSAHGVAFHARTLDSLMEGDNGVLDAFRKLGSITTFVHGWSSTALYPNLAAIWPSPTLAIQTATNVQFADVPAAGAHRTSELAGADLPLRLAEIPVFASGIHSGIIPLLSIKGLPFTVEFRAAAAVILATTLDVVDPHQRAQSEDALMDALSSLLPAIVFVRTASGEFRWQASSKTARLIIDDPVLRDSYGGLKLQELLTSAEQHQYGATIAFIPWNHFRTSRDIVPKLAPAADRFSICVHGCDHNNNEYGIADEEKLLAKSNLALRRMQSHTERTGLPFERVMVFPQGHFSSESLRALRHAGFLAAVNSTRFPIYESPSTSLRDLLSPALTQNSGFPVFLRHYPRAAFPFLLDAFLSKPIFLVEHHEFFEDGFPGLEALVAKLNSKIPGLRWPPIQTALEHFCWKRPRKPGVYDVRFFTDILVYRNVEDRPIEILATKTGGGDNSTLRVLVNGKQHPFEVNDGDVITHIKVPETSSVRVQLLLSPSARRYYSGGPFYATSVFTRRALSEFRDEFLFKHPALLRVAKRTVNALGLGS